uniref:Ptk1 n=1 Tax=Arundo donax TaxID=35708 RepID=A0A0A9C1K3_ARUDO
MGLQVQFLFLKLFSLHLHGALF